jgi:lipoprotein-anchoring transpeptidase ErfK/SrfK
VLVSGRRRVALAAVRAGRGRPASDVALALIASAAFAVAGLPAAAAHAGTVTALSNERTVSRWAYPTAEVAVHERPSAASRTVALHLVRGYLRVDRASLRATLYRDGRAIFSAPIGVGKSSTVTPRGSFYVLEKLITVGAPAYGPYAIGTSAYAPTLREWPGGGVVGIHGTNEPQLIPGRPSHGCIRLRNADVARLWRLIALGTPIDIV